MLLENASPHPNAQMTASASNRRVTARRACRLTVRYSAAHDWHPATVMDLSDRGCRLRVGESLARGGRLRVQFEVPLRDGASMPSVELRADVIWSRVEGISHQIGLVFEESPAALQEVLAALA
jgi:PilZ domain